MTCPTCRAALQLSPNGSYARCPSCEALYMTYGGHLRPVSVPEGMDPALFLQGIGLGAPLPPDPMTATKEALEEKASNVGVRVKAAGVRVDLDRGGVDVDTSKLQKNIEHKVEQKVGQWIFGCFLTLFIFGAMAAVLILVGGYVGWQVMAGGGGSSASAAEAEWDGSSTYVCPPNGNVPISDVTARVPGVGVQAGGNCVLTLEDVSIDAATAIEASGNAKVTLEGGSHTGSTAAIDASANATVTVDGATVTGPPKRSGNGKINGL